jgi:hypothetical protein
VPALCAAFVVVAHAFGPPILGSFAEFVFFAVAMFFGGGIALLLWRLFTTRSVVTITPEGIRDVRVAAELIPWSAIDHIAIWDKQVMLLTVDPAVEAGLTLTRLTRWTRASNRAVGVELGFAVTAMGLKIGFDELLATTQAYARAWQSRAAD